ncbi:MAG TPA: 2-phospho-L-lactate guanylyltransferase [archaeon]|nr:2-phospho-L-lactate guanylyltransferase [archaeon]
MKRQGSKADVICAIVPVNVLRESKARLVKQLDASSRSRLSAAMLMDVLHALLRVERIGRVTVVSADYGVRRIIRPMRAHFLWEGKRKGLNKGVRLAMRDARRRKFSAALVVPSDLPLVTPREILRFLRAADDYSVAVTPSKDGSGTNALFLRPPGVISPAFGENSFRKHLLIANRKGLSVRVVKSAGIASDVDDPEDLVDLNRLLLKNETGRFLSMVNGRGFANRTAKSKFNWSAFAK